MSSYIRGGSTRHSDDTMDDDTDDTKRKSRNLSEKKRRDQFNLLVNELGSMVSTNTRKMDKSTVLKSTISFLKNHNEVAVRSRAHEIQEDWKPSFLSNEEFTHLILEALDGFIMAFSSSGRIYYASQSVTSLLGYLPSDLVNTSIYEIAYPDDQTQLYNILANSAEAQDQRHPDKENQISFTCHIKVGGLDFREEAVYEPVQFLGYFRSDVDLDLDVDNFIQNDRVDGVLSNDTKLVFVGTGHLQTPQLIREMSIIDSEKLEFTSRHSLEWKFLFLDHRAPPIIGYLPIEVLGTSGYDYYHVDDLDKVVTCHEALMQKGEGTSCHYRFLTKGQQWIWLQTRFYITYNQWNSKPEFVVCTHRVVSYANVMKFSRKTTEEFDKCEDLDVAESPSNRQQRQVATFSQIDLALSPWSSKSSKTSRSVAVPSRPQYHGGPGSDTTSVSAGSQSSKQSHQALHNTRLKAETQPMATVSSRGKTHNQNHPQPDVSQACVGFLEPPQYVAAIPVQPIITASFTTPAAPAGIPSLPTTEILSQQSIVITEAQNQMQDELQRKHEELQQLIVHQQEELRRVSEQLLFARYGIISPLLNVSMPYAPSACQQAVRCIGSTSSSASRSLSSPGVQSLSVLPVPITLSVPVVSSELFPHPLAISPASTAAAPSNFSDTRTTVDQQFSGHSGSTPQQQQQHQQQDQEQQQHLEQQQQQLQHFSEESHPTDQDGPPVATLMSFQVCQHTEL